METKIKQVKCPGCHKLVLFTPENPFRPFCSERCKLIDLGDWAEGKYAVPVSSPLEVEDEEAMQDDQETGDDSPFSPGSGTPRRH